MLERVPGVFKVVDQGTLLDEVVLIVDVSVLHLLLSVHQVTGLYLFDHVSPLSGDLLELIASVHIVEDGELGAQDEGEVPDLNVADVPSDQEFVVPDHSAQPFVVRPASQTRKGSDRADVAKKEEKASAAACERFVVRRHLLGAYGVKELAHVLVVREY